MRNRSAHVLIAVLTAAGAIACANPNNNNHPTSLRDATGEARGQNERLMLKGCLAEASRGDEFILRDATLLPAAEQQRGQAVEEHGSMIPPGSWVRLAGGTQDLKGLLGQRVQVSGDVVDPGNNTIGTSGNSTKSPDELRKEAFARSSKDADSNPERAQAPTTVAPAMADANGDAPRIAIETISKTDGSCAEKAEK